MSESPKEEIFNVIKHIHIHGLCSPTNYHSYRKANFFITSIQCSKCHIKLYNWNDVVSCIKCHSYCHRSCMRNQQEVCPSHKIRLNDHINHLSSNDFTLLNDNKESEFWSLCLNNFLKSSDIVSVPKDLRSISFNTKGLDQSTSLLFTLSKPDFLLTLLCTHFRQIFYITIPYIHDKNHILTTARACFDSLAKFTINQLPSNYYGTAGNNTQYQQVLISIYNTIDNYMLQYDNMSLYNYLYSISIDITTDNHNIYVTNVQHNIQECHTSTDYSNDYFYQNLSEINDLLIRMNNMKNCVSGMDKIKHLMELFQTIAFSYPIDIHATSIHVDGEGTSDDADKGSKSSNSNSVDARAGEGMGAAKIGADDKGDSNSSSVFVKEEEEDDVSSDDCVVEGDDLLSSDYSSTSAPYLSPTVDEDGAIIYTTITESILLFESDNEIRDEVSQCLSDLIDTIHLSSTTPSGTPQTTPTTARRPLLDLTHLASSSAASIQETFDKAILWLPSSYQAVIQQHVLSIQHIQNLILKQPLIARLIGTSTSTRGTGESSTDPLTRPLVPVSTEMLILRIRYLLLLYTMTYTATGTTGTGVDVGECCNWHAEYVYESYMIPDGPWMLGPSGYALATLYTALR